MATQNRPKRVCSGVQSRDIADTKPRSTTKRYFGASVVLGAYEPNLWERQQHAKADQRVRWANRKIRARLVNSLEIRKLPYLEPEKPKTTSRYSLSHRAVDRICPTCGKAKRYSNTFWCQRCNKDPRRADGTQSRSRGKWTD